MTRIYGRYSLNAISLKSERIGEYIEKTKRVRQCWLLICTTASCQNVSKYLSQIII